MSESVNELRNIGLVGHGGAGKTALAESLLFGAGVTKRLGSVEEGNTVMDFEPEEVRRHTSISTAFHQYTWKKHKVNIMDTPGDANFFSDARSCLQAADSAIVVVEAIDGVKVQTEQAWEFADQIEMPRVVFINKMDRDRADFFGTLKDVAEIFTPKPILLTHKNLEFACVIENRHHNQTHEDNFLCIPPLYHTGAKMHWFGNFIVGAKAIILKGVKPQWILEAISEEKVTIVWLLVPWAQDILIAIENNEVNLSDYQLDQWRLMHIGAQPVPPSLIKNWKKVFPHHDYDTNYGLSETTGPGCVHLGMENLHKVGAIGVPGFDWEFKIVDYDLKEVVRGEPGELMVKGPGVMKEYYNNPEATKDTLIDGWLLTGDMARVDEDGFIWLVDRKKDVIITGGENIFPVEIEDFLMENRKMQDAAVIGIPDERLGEIVTAIVQVKPGQEMNEEEFLAYCEGLPRYKRPRKVFFDEVPRNPTGKIEKPKLREKYAGITESFKV